MGSKGVQGNVLICAPPQNLMTPKCCCTPKGSSNIQDEELGSSSQKKKRSKPKLRNAVKEVKGTVFNTEPNESPRSVIEKTVEKVQVAIDLLNLQTTPIEETQKPKKVRKRKKSSNEKEKNVEVCDRTENASKLYSIKEDKECKPGDRSVKGVKSVLQEKKKHQLSSSKHSDPFFPDNKKGATRKKSNAKTKGEKEMFEDYLSAAEVENGLKNKTMVAGAIRINSRCYKEAYISSLGDEKDIMIEGLQNRNRALEGDEVVVLINTPDSWKASGQRTGKVVYIQEYVHTRTCIGKLPSTVELNSSYVVFSPRDSRVPRIKLSISDTSLPPQYLRTPALYTDILFNAQITDWTDVNFAQGTILGEVGRLGDVEVETMAILLENNLDPRPISPILNLFFPRMPYTIPSSELEKRMDLRKECVFTIDPATARDLDDAVSLKKLENGNFEVGVHISDVSFFLHHNTLLDKTVCRRATTIYLVQRVYHMLPEELCMLCSLTPGEDKLAFSVFVELTPDAQVVSHRFARTVIHSCAKLAYEHAQMVIDNADQPLDADKFPEITNGFSAEDCKVAIIELFKLSVIMRSRRFATGALRIDQPKLNFRLDPDHHTPQSCFIYENKESHRLIEEFMLLANMTVAEHIYRVYPKLAFLRRHEPPRPSMMIDVQKKLELYGIHLDMTDAGSLHTSMAKYSSAVANEEEVVTWARYIVLNNLCAKTMLRAKYFCPSSQETPDLHHYALNASCYTHFTSPIRRYADVMVHRLLEASLDLAPPPSWTANETQRIAEICNRQKLAAKVAGEQSSQLFLALYLQDPVESAASVIDVKDRSLDVIVKDFGVMLRVYTDPLPAKVQFQNEDNMPQLSIQWKATGQVQCVQLFSVVRVQVSRAKEGLKLSAMLLPPKLQLIACHDVP